METAARKESSKKRKVESEEGKTWGEELSLAEPAREEFLRGGNNIISSLKMRRHKFIPLTLHKMDLRRLVAGSVMWSCG